MYNAPVYNLIKKDVLSRYPDRNYYHGVGHIEKITDLFNFRYDDFLKFPNFKSGFKDGDNIYDITMVALLFHDIVYKVGRKDNEEKSVDYALEYLNKRKLFGEYEYYLISDIILYTKMEHDSGTPLKQLVHDLDWMAFSVYSMLCNNDALLLNEALRDGYTKEQFRQGTVKFLTFYLKRDIYESPIYRKFNDSARENIKRFLKEFYSDLI